MATGLQPVPLPLRYNFPILQNLDLPVPRRLLHSPLQPRRLAPRQALPRGHQPGRTPARSVPGSPSTIMSSQTILQIVGHPTVKSPISTLEQVCQPVHLICFYAVPYMNQQRLNFSLLGTHHSLSLSSWDLPLTSPFVLTPFHKLERSIGFEPM